MTNSARYQRHWKKHRLAVISLCWRGLSAFASSSPAGFSRFLSLYRKGLSIFASLRQRRSSIHESLRRNRSAFRSPIALLSYGLVGFVIAWIVITVIVLLPSAPGCSNSAYSSPAIEHSDCLRGASTSRRCASASVWITGHKVRWYNQQQCDDTSG